MPRLKALRHRPVWKQRPTPAVHASSVGSGHLSDPATKHTHGQYTPAPPGPPLLNILAQPLQMAHSNKKIRANGQRQAARQRKATKNSTDGKINSAQQNKQI